MCWLHVSCSTILIKFDHQKLLASDNIFIPLSPFPSACVYIHTLLIYLSQFPIAFLCALSFCSAFDVCLWRKKLRCHENKLINIFNPLKFPVQNNRLAGQAVTGIETDGRSPEQQMVTWGRQTLEKFWHEKSRVEVS